MTDNNRHGVQRFVDRGTQAQDGLGHMQSIVTELAGRRACAAAIIGFARQHLIRRFQSVRWRQSAQ